MVTDIFLNLQKVASSQDSFEFSSGSCITFPEILLAVQKFIYYDHMKASWDAFFSDLVVEYCGSWLKRKHWLDLPVIVESGRQELSKMCEMKKFDDEVYSSFSKESLWVKASLYSLMILIFSCMFFTLMLGCTSVSDT